MRAAILLITAWLITTVPAWAESLPPFSVTDGQGRTVTLEEFRGRVVLLDFWATWCAPCLQEMPQLEALQLDYGERGLSVVAVSIDRVGLPRVKPFYQRHGLTALGLYLDDERIAARVLGIETLPSAILIGRDGQVLARLDGAHDWQAERPRIEAALR